MTNALNTAEELKRRGFVMRDPPLLLLCYDPAGQGADNDAVVILSREEHRRGEVSDPDLAVEMIWRILQAEYFPVDFEWSDKIAKILSIHRGMRRWADSGRAAGTVILVESNGVGYAASSVLREKLSSQVLSYTTVGKASEETHASNKLIMPRLAALDLMRLQLELHRLKGVKGGKGVDDIQKELGGIVWARPGRPEALPGQRDDMTMALTAGIWFGTKVIPPLTKADPSKEPRRAQHGGFRVIH